MTEVPEHLLRRSRERREALGVGGGGGGGEGGHDAPPEPGPGDDVGEKIPASLLTGEAASPAAAAAAPAAPAAAAAVATAPPLKGPEGHTQRLLTVVKAGSIQDVKAQPTDKVHVWPHLLVGEFVASLAMTAFLLVFSALVNAPLLATANFNFTPNPSKAPWYFLGLQELLTMFHPMVAGVTIPGIGIFALILVPFSDRNASQ